MDQTAGVILEWRARDVPVSVDFDDPYYSLDDGLAEARHVFLQGNDLPARFAPDLRIAELGFGTGLNLLATWAAWEASGQDTPLHFTSFEAFPLGQDQMRRALAGFPALAGHTARFLEAFDGCRADLPTLTFRLVGGDARRTLPQWNGTADAWYLDGFSPAKNPELWEVALLCAVAGHTRAGGSVATYTAAGRVRRTLAEAGFAVARVPGYGRKRHMTIGRKLPDC